MFRLDLLTKSEQIRWISWENVNKHDVVWSSVWRRSAQKGESPGQHPAHSSAVEGDDGEYLNIFTEEPRSLVSLTLELAELRSNTNKVSKFDKNF